MHINKFKCIQKNGDTQRQGKSNSGPAEKKTLLLSLLNVCVCVIGAVLLLTVNVLTRCDIAVSRDK